MALLIAQGGNLYGCVTFDNPGLPQGMSCLESLDDTQYYARYITGYMVLALVTLFF